MSLSVCVCASRPAAVVLPLLRLVRPLADELVIGVDEAAPADLAAGCSSLADRTFTLAVPKISQAFGWLYHQCGGDWILRLDDDEAPSAALLQGLRGELDGRATAVAVPRRWLYPDGSTYIATRPWTPDYQLRLFRNLPGIWSFPGLIHDELAVVGERRFADLPLYHLDLLLSDLDSRREKAARYEQDRPGHLAEGFPVNDMYIPELVPGVVTAPVPDEDRALLERLAGDNAPAGEPRRVRAVADSELRRFDTARQIALDARHARVTLPRGVPALRAGETRCLEVEVTNLGDEWWPAADGPPPVRVSSRWRGRHDVRLADGPRAAFTEEVDPGGTTRVLLPVTGPNWPGRYRLEVGVLQEGVGWFRGGAEATVVIEPSSDRAEVGVQAPGGTYRALVEPLVERARLAVGERAAIPVRVRNEGSLEWDSSGRSRPPVTVSCRWIDSRGVVVVMDAPRTPLREPVPPGGEATLGLDVAAPVRPGSYTIEIDLVEEGVRWFGAARPLAVDVRAPLPLGARRSWARRRAPVRRARLHREIPPILHRIWIGDAPLPAEFEAFGQTWRQHHPEWEFRTWGDEDAEALVPRRDWRGSRSPSELSNLLRYEILRRHGGVYVDTDVECRRPIDSLLAGASAFAGWERQNRLGTAVLASAPRHPVFELAAREARLTRGLGLDSVEANGPGFFTQVVAERPLIMAYPKEHFYPYLWDEPHRRHEPFPQSFAVHHWTLSWKLSESS